MPDNQTKKIRINRALEESGKSQRDLAKAMGKSSAAVSEMLSKEGEIDSISYLEATAELTGFSFEWLRTGKGEEKAKDISVVEDRTLTYLSGKNIRPVTVIVDNKDKELISYVPVKARAGYMRGYADAHFMEKLPSFSLPMLKHGSYRAFEVDGDSMQQLGGGGLHSGDVVIAKYVEDIFSIRDNRVYVVIGTEGVFVKRCLNKLRDEIEPSLVCNSDNKSGAHPRILLRPNDILEVWELVIYFSRQITFSTDLWQMLKDFQVEQALQAERIGDLERKTAALPEPASKLLLKTGSKK